MRKITGLIAVLILAASCSGFQESYQANSNDEKKEDKQDDGQIVTGGGCAYETFAGNCTVTAIPEYDYLAFRYEGQSAKGKIKVEGCSMDFTRITPYSGSLPSKSEIAKALNISVGKSYGCDLSCATAGTCTPHGFSFKDLGSDDYKVSGFGLDGCDFTDLCVD